MIKKQLRHLVINEHMSIYQGYWNYSKYPTISIVCDNDEKYVGIIEKSDYDLTDIADGSREVGSIVNRDALVIVSHGDEDAIYSDGRNIFAESDQLYVPIISSDGDILDLFYRDRAFYLNSYREGTLDRMSYSILTYAAAKEADYLGVKGISVCEFGVAGGKGLLAAQFHAREISRLTGVDIHVFGFDLGTGMPTTDNPTDDLAHWFYPGAFDTTNNHGRLFDRLYRGNELILGDIKDTVGHFFDTTRYPVGAVFVDVDLYSSTRYILNWMGDHPEDENFLPRVFMYFDDVHGLLEGTGEHKALTEFNAAMDSVMRISPDGAGTISDLHTLDAIYGVYSKWLYTRHTAYPYGRMKLCHRFKDPRYNRNAFLDKKRDKRILKGMAMI